LRPNLVDSFNEEWNELPMVKKFHTCLLSPLVPKDVKDKYYNCLKRNDGEVSKCPKTFENFKRKGIVEMGDMLYSDNHGVLKTILVHERCSLHHKEAREKNCDIFPESPDCREIKEKAFFCITKVGCKELSEASVKCFGDAAKEEETGLFLGIVTGIDEQAKMRKQDTCSKIQTDLIHCFEKYFLTSLILHPDKNFTIKMPKDQMPIAGYKKEWVTTDRVDHTIPRYIEDDDE
jgi:hypothetical protein